MKLKEILDRTVNFFKEKSFDTPRLDAELLLAHGLKIERIQLYLKFDQPLSDLEISTLRELVRRRAQGEPIAQILGFKDFYKSRFLVTPKVLIPRPETELLVEEALRWAHDKYKAWGIVDLGSGSGCIGLSLLKELQYATLVSVDFSEEAIAVARANAENLGVADRVRFVQSDAKNTDIILTSYKEVTGKDEIDILVSNPPYIAPTDIDVDLMVKKYEPALALYAEEDGLQLLKNWTQAYGSYLAKPSLVLMEMGRLQGERMFEFYSSLGVFQSVQVLKDLSGHDRIIRGEVNG